MNEVSRRSVLKAAAAGTAGIGMSAFLASCGAAPAGDLPLDELARSLKGNLLLPGQDSYEKLYAPANTIFANVRPLALAMCADENDVAVAAKWCVANSVLPTVRGGGHNYVGASTSTGLIVDLGLLRQAQVDSKTGRAVVGGATRNGDLFAYYDRTPLAEQNWILPAGTCPQVGIGGLVLGGGIGYNTTWAGLTSDHLVSTRVVTASGDILTANASENSDLFWACRGGAGGNYGICTEFTFQFAAVPRPRIGYYRLEWDGAEAAQEVLTAYDKLQQSAPASFSSVVSCTAVPIKAGQSGRDAIKTMSRGLFIGSQAELDDVIAPLVAITNGRSPSVPGPSVQGTQELEFWAAQKYFRGSDVSPHAFADATRFTKQPLPTQVPANVVALVADAPRGAGDLTAAVWCMGWVGGSVVGGVPASATAYVHRDVTTLVRPTIAWPTDSLAGKDLRAWRDQVVADYRPYTPNESYQNFPCLDLADYLEAYYGTNLNRLIDVKTKYDPKNLFKYVQSIPVR